MSEKTIIKLIRNKMFDMGIYYQTLEKYYKKNAKFINRYDIWQFSRNTKEYLNKIAPKNKIFQIYKYND